MNARIVILVAAGSFAAGFGASKLVHPATPLRTTRPAETTLPSRIASASQDIPTNGMDSAQPAGSFSEGIAKIVNEPDAERRMGKFYALADGITDRNGREAAEAIRKLPGFPQKILLLHFAMSS